jgi:hypothetical protein
MHRDFSSSELRDLIASVNIWDRKFGAHNCYFELFDAMNQLGVCVILENPTRRHAVRYVIKDEADKLRAWNEMAAWVDRAATGEKP